MTDRYLYSGAGGSANGTSWANAYTTISAASTAMANGDRLFIAHDHSETATGASFKGSVSLPCIYICVNRAGSVPPVSADLRTTAAINASATNLTMSGYAYVYGIAFTLSGNNNLNLGTTTGALCFDSCSFALTNGANTNAIFFGSTLNDANRFYNCSFSWANAAVGLSFNGGVNDFFGCAFPSATTTFIKAGTARFGRVRFMDTDLSGMGSGKTLVGTNLIGGKFLFERCKFGASLTVIASQNAPETQVDLINCDSGATQYRSERHTMCGDLTTETTIVLSSGATDGTTPFSHKIATTSLAQFPYYNFESFPMGEFYAGSLGSSISQTFEIVTDNVTLTNKDCWIDFEYLGSSGAPNGTFVFGMADPLSAGTNLTSSSVTWTTTGLTTPVKQKIVVNFTPNMVGLYRAVLKVAKASTTLYLSPPAAKAA